MNQSVDVHTGGQNASVVLGYELANGDDWGPPEETPLFPLGNDGVAEVLTVGHDLCLDELSLDEIQID